MRKNNKALYERIMRNVSREVKRALNESINMDNLESIKQYVFELAIENTDFSRTGNCVIELDDPIYIKRFNGTTIDFIEVNDDLKDIYVRYNNGNTYSIDEFSYEEQKEILDAVINELENQY